MNGSKIVTGPVKSRHTRIIKVAPVTRAIRAALAISVTAMALSGSSVAFAGTCTPPSSNTIYCDGSFLDTITFPDVDLTLVVGQNAPSSVTPGTGAVGIEADWPGNVNVTNYADITTHGADGIYAYGSTSAQVVNRGTITAGSASVPPPAPMASDSGASAYITVPGSIAIDAIAYGNVTVINSGYAASVGTGVYDVTAVLAESTGIGYTATVDNQSAGAIFAFTDGSGSAVGVYGVATNGDVNVSNDGLVVAVSYYGLADAIFASGDSVDVSSSNLIYAIGSSWAAGIEAQGSDLTTVNNSGLIYAAAAGAYGHAFGVYATSGAGGTTVYNRGTIDVLGPYATGIEAQSNGGAVNVRNVYGANLTIGNAFTSYFATGIDTSTSYDNSNIFVYNGGGITALSHYGSTGIQAVATGAGSTVNVINTGSVYVNTSGRYASMGIVVSGDGDASIYSNGAVTVAYGGNSTGLEALSFNGTAAVNNVGKVDVTAANYTGNGFGVVASSANGVARAYNSGSVSVTAGYYGFGIDAAGMTQARVRNSGRVTVNAKYGYGIVASAGTGYVNVYNDASGTVNVTGSTSAIGILGITTQGDISIGNGGTVSATGYGQAIGIFAHANAGNVSVSNNGNLNATSYLGPAIGLVAIASGGNAFANASGTSNIQAYSSGNTAIGIEVQADDGTATAYNLGDISATAGQNPAAMYYSGALGIADGIFATGQSVRVWNDGGITATGYGWAAGIEAQGSNATSISNDGAINATSTGAYSHAFGVYATGGAGGVSIGNSGTVNVQGSYATGIEAQAQGGGISIVNFGDITVGNSNRTYYATGIDAATNYAASNIYVYNGGGVTALSYFGSTGIAAVATGTGSGASVRNTGNVYVDTAGKYGSTGIIVSADGDANISNSGSVTVAYGGNSYGAVAVAFNGNSGVTNSGSIDVTAANYIGSGYGIVSSSANGAASVYNTGTGGTVSVNAGYYGFGIQASGMTGSTVYNFGAVDVHAKYGYGILATSGQGNVSIRDNSKSSVDVTSTSGTALGIAGIATLGDVSISNDGSVSAAAYANAFGIFARADAGSVTVVNGGDILATSALAPAIGILANATGGTVTAYNIGTITATSQGDAAIGIEGQGDGAVNINNSGDITVAGGTNAYSVQYTGALGLADGIFASGQTVYVRNDGSIDATGYGWAAGIEAQGSDQTTVRTGGTIVATSTGAYSHAFGVYATGGATGVSISNSGSITAMGSYATGIQAQSSGGIGISNSGDITVGDANASYFATGISAATNYASSNINIGNSGSITANSYYGSTGIAAVATGAGSTGYASNSGSIYVNTTGKYNSMGIVVSSDGDARIYNTSAGSVTVAYGGSSYGEVALAFNGNATVQNNGDVNVTGAGLVGSGYGIIASSANGAANVSNSGSVTVYGGYTAIGIQAGGLTGASVGNGGTVAVDTAKYGYGILATSGTGNVQIYNGTTGVVDVYSYAGSALGITGIATLGDVMIYSRGNVSVSGYTDTIGIFAQADAGSASVNSGGVITAFDYVSPAIGILAQANAPGRFALVYNSGSISATSQGDAAIGIEVLSGYGVATVTNAGDITVTGGADAYATQYTGSLGLADGIFASGQTVRVANNNGNIDATGYGWAAGIEAQGSDSTIVGSNGTITATSTGAYSHAFGIYASSGASGLSVDTGGSITVLGPYATGIQAQSSGAINIGNSGNITAGNANTSYYATGISAATNYAGGNIFVRNDGGVTANSYFGSTGIAAVATGAGSNVTVVNSGDVYVNTAGKYGSMGIVVSADGNANIYSTGSITVAYGGTSYGALALAFNGNASVANLGDVNVTSAGLIGYGFGLVSSSSNGAASVYNHGTVSVYAGYLAAGIQASSLTGTTVGNSGSIAVDTARYGYGILATSGTGNVAIGNSSAGSVDVYSYAGSALGITGIATLGDVSVYNAGSVSASGYIDTIGIFARAHDGNVFVNSAAGSITAFTYISPAIGVLAHATGGDATVYNGSSITVTSLGEAAIGIEGQSDTGAVHVSNSGDISATGDASALVTSYTGALGVADGILALGQTVNVGNSGDITATGYAFAAGIDAQGVDFASVNSSGTITATTSRAYSKAYGAHVLSGGDVYVSSSGAIYADASAAKSGSFGVHAIATDNVGISNSGLISTTAYEVAEGVVAWSAFGDVSVTNSGDILASSGPTVADLNFVGQAFGIVAGAGTGDVTIVNSGTVTVASQASYVVYNPITVVGIDGQSEGTTAIDNSGDISATATLVAAFGIVSFSPTIQITNSGDIVADGHSGAIGIEMGAVYQSTLNNSGSIAAYSNEPAAIYGAFGAFGAAVQSNLGNVSVVNSGDIYAAGSGGDSHGVMAIALSHNVSIVNSGSISAIADGIATGVTAMASGIASVTNSGSITATAPLYAVAVSLNSGDYSILTNTATGVITTYAALEGNIAVHGGDGFENVLNYGYIHGAIVTNGGIDQLFNGNGGLWLVDNHSTDFGDGDDIVGNAAGGTIQLTNGAITLGAGNDTLNNGGSILLTNSAIYLGAGNDTITNGGTIHLTDSAIYLGAGSGNSFTNNGTIKVSGNSLIDMGTGAPPPDDSFVPTAVPSLNAIPLVNNGVIDFLDGMPDDVLTIVGDLGGNGAIDIDVSLLNGTSDMLYVDGSIANGGVQTVNVAFDQLPTAAITTIPFAHVTGNSVDGSFVAGTFAAGSVINYDPSNFLNLQLGVTSQIDPTNATDDVFSIGLDVAGLNDTGTLAASVASGVQSLVNSQIGTWRQRMGVLPEKGPNDAGLSPWFRVFNDQGTVNPAHVADNFPQAGNFNYDQSNSGQEVGMNVNPGQRGFNFGLLLSKSEGNQHLVAPGVGSDRIKSNAVGVYGTWISPKGYYVDASYRWINFDAALHSSAGEQDTKGYASALNLEAGYDAWTLSGGMKITPQAQYTRTRVGNIDALHGDSATFVANGGDSSRARLGVEFSKSIKSDSDFIWTPYGSLNAVHEFDGRTRYAINNTFFGSTSVEGTSAMVELGLGMQKGGLSITGGVNWTDGGALKSFTGGQLELRYSW
jgi:hypothetical protein